MLKKIVQRFKTTSDPTNKSTSSKIKRGASQGVLFLALFVGLSSFMARNMISNDHQVPSLAQQSSLLALKDSYPALAEWKDHPIHLVYFFAPWCTVCALSQPSLEAFHALHPEIPITLIALDWETENEVLAYQQKHEFDLPIFLGDHSFKSQWQVDAYPSYYFVDQEGKVKSKDRGLVTLPGLIARSL